MNRKVAECTAAALALSLTLGGMSTTYAATTMTLAGAGFKTESTAPQTEAAAQEETVKETEAAKKEEKKEQKKQKAAANETQAAQTAEPQTVEPQTEAPQAVAPQTEAPQTEPQIDRSMVGTTGFAKADDYINVRAEGYAEADVVGSLSKNDAVYIEDVDADGWYKIRSGNVEGYVAGYLIATGAEADAAAQSAAYTYAQVGAESLNVRADASQDAEVVDMASQGADLEVVEDLGDWVKVVTPDGIYGYVSADYVSTQTVYPTGETVQEQSEREEAEYLAAVAEWEAQAAAQEAAEKAAVQQMVASMGPEVEALYQAYLAAQEAAMHPVDEADAQAKAEAAIAAYNAYIAAANGQTPSQTTDGTGSSDDSSDDGEYIDVVADDSGDSYAEDDEYEDDEYEDDEYEDDEYEDDEYEDAEVYVEDDEEEQTTQSSGNSLGAQIASYATQFVGNPYVYGGASLTGGADCSGFTMAVFAHFGIGLPHNAAAQSGCGRQVSLSDLQPGDLLFYNNGGGIGHVTLYIGGGQVVHASSPETGIKISPYNYRSPVCAVRCW